MSTVSALQDDRGCNERVVLSLAHWVRAERSRRVAPAWDCDMRLRCLFGHEWRGCKCARCDKVRRNWNGWGVECERCGKCHALLADAIKAAEQKLYFVAELSLRQVISAADYDVLIELRRLVALGRFREIVCGWRDAVEEFERRERANVIYEYHDLPVGKLERHGSESRAAHEQLEWRRADTIRALDEALKNCPRGDDALWLEIYDYRKLLK